MVKVSETNFQNHPTIDSVKVLKVYEKNSPIHPHFETNHLDKGEGGNRWKIREVGVMERS